MIKTIKLSSKGQIVIPEKMRKAMKIKEGSEVVAYTKNNKIIIETEKEFKKTLEKIEEQREREGWLRVAESSMDDWFTPQEDEAWKHL